MPVLCDEVLEEAEQHGTVLMVVKDGEPFVRIEPSSELIREWCKRLPTIRGKTISVEERNQRKAASRHLVTERDLRES